MKKTLLTIFLFAIVFTSCGQNNCSIKRGYAFYTVSMPGMIMRDDNGNEVAPIPSVQRFIYIECSGTKMPVIETVLYDNISLKTAITSAIGSTVTVGKNFQHGEDYKLTAARGNQFWKIDLYPVDDKQLVKRQNNNIIIKSKEKSKLCKFYIYKETELMTLPRY